MGMFKMPHDSFDESLVALWAARHFPIFKLISRLRFNDFDGEEKEKMTSDNEIN